MSKFYAIRKGRKTGIFTSWNECKKYIIGFKGAEYKSFETEEEAKVFLESEKIEYNENSIDIIDTYAFVDGSFNEGTDTYGYGGFLIHKEISEEGIESITKMTITGSGNDEDMVAMRNIAGEIMGSQKAVELAIELGYPEITIFYDYMGIEMWANGLWKRNKQGTINYYEFMQKAKEKIKIHFIKVKGHTGIEGNEEADILAKKAVGILPMEDTDYTFKLTHEMLDCRICDIEPDSNNDETYREYLVDSMNEFQIVPDDSLDEMSDEDLTALFNFIDDLWYK